MKIISFLIAFIITVDCFSQTADAGKPDSAVQNIIFFDDFSNNKNNWTIGSNRKMTARIDSGFYYLKANGHAYGEAQDIKINTRKDFEIETRVKIVSGDAEHRNYYSMLFWGREAMDGYYFTFAGDGFASVEVCSGKNQTDCLVKKGSLQKTQMDPVGFNVYTIRKTGRTYTFLINGTKFYEMPFAPLFGNLVGIGAGRNVSLAIDYLKVSYL